MIIFGAGASHDVAQTFPVADRPPLADRLFDPRFGAFIDRYEQCTGLVPMLRAPLQRNSRSQGRSLEEILETITKDAETHQDTDRLIELAAVRFYLRDVAEGIGAAGLRVNGVTNYAALLSLVLHRRFTRDAPVALVTFNYDTLLDDAVRRVFRVPLNASAPGDYGLSRFVDGDPRIRVFKPHGAWNWTRLVRDPHRGVGISELINAAPTLRFDDRYLLNQRLDSTIGPDFEKSGDVMYPWLALPLRAKTEFSWPKSHQDRFVSILAQVTHLVVIGWRGADTHFLRLIDEFGGMNLRAIDLVTGSVQTGADLVRELGNHRVRFVAPRTFPNGFSSYIQHLATEGIDAFLQT